MHVARPLPPRLRHPRVRISGRGGLPAPAFPYSRYHDRLLLPRTADPRDLPTLFVFLRNPRDASTHCHPLSLSRHRVRLVVFDRLRLHVQVQRAAHPVRNRGGRPAANRKARSTIKSRLESGIRLSDQVSGKAMISKLSGWSHEEFGVNLSAASLSRSIARDEIPSEVIDLLTRIERTG